MKKLLFVLVVVVVVILAAPAIVGFQAEGHYQNLVKQLQKSGFTVVADEYHRGWMQSTVKTQLSLPIPQDEITDAEPKQFAFTLNSEITHGPWLDGLAEIETVIQLDDENLFPDDYPANISTLIAMDGSGRTVVDLPEAELDATEDRPSVRFAGLQGEVMFDASFSDVHLDLRMPALQIGNGEQQVASFSGISVNSHSWKNSTGLVLGDGRFAMKKFSVDDGQETQFDLENVIIEAESQEQDGAVKASVKYQLQKAMAAEAAYGPAELKISVDRLPSDVLLKIQQAMEEMNEKQMSPSQQQMAAMSVLLSSGPAVLEADPQLMVDRLHVVTPEGVISGQMSMQSIGLKWAEISNISQVVAKLQVNAQLRVPKVYAMDLATMEVSRRLQMQQLQQIESGNEEALMDAEQLEEMASQMANDQMMTLLEQGLISEEGQDYTSRLKMEDGLLTINGKGFPLPF